MALSGKQRRYLRGLGHHLEPIVHVGKEGHGAGLVAAVEAALVTHELIKIKVGNAAPEGKDEVAAALAAATGAEIAQTMGHSILLYRARAEKPTIKLPARGGDGTAGDDGGDAGDGDGDGDGDNEG